MSYKDFGYLLFVSKNENVDYLPLAYCLALSIKNTQKEGFDKVALVADDIDSVERLKSPWVFDKVISWSEVGFWDCRSWMDKLTPWEYTVCLDVDQLFFRDYSHWIEYFLGNDIELFLPSTVYTYRGNIAKDNFYRKTFEANELPNLYSLFTYFKKDTEICRDFFTLSRHITKFPKEFKNIYLSQNAPKIVGTDEAFALAAKILGIEDEITYDLNFLKLIHLKPMIQDWPWPANSISDHVGLYFDLEARLKIDNFQQHDIVHYNEKDFVTEEIISILENKLWKK